MPRKMTDKLKDPHNFVLVTECSFVVLSALSVGQKNTQELADATRYYLQQNGVFSEDLSKKMVRIVQRLIRLQYIERIEVHPDYIYRITTKGADQLQYYLFMLEDD